MRKSEKLTCPPEFQQHLTDIFGVNRFGDPLFRFIWGQTESEVMLNSLGYYEERLVGANSPCWILQQWHPPEEYGPPEVFYYLYTDLDCGLPVMEYPEFGRYHDLVSFLGKNYNAETKELEITTIPLDWVLIDRAIPLMIKSLELSDAMKKSISDEARIAEETAQVQLIADMLADRLPTFYGPTSYAKQDNRTALLDRKKAEIEQEWKRRNLREQPMRGFWQKN